MKTQIWITVSVYVLVAIVRSRTRLDASLHTFLQILSLTLFERTPVNQLLSQELHTNNTPHQDNQLKLFI